MCSGEASGGGGPNSIGTPVILTDAKGVVHPNAVIAHSVDNNPVWATVLGTDVKVAIPPPVGDFKVVIPLVTFAQFTVIAQKSAVPIPGKPSYTPSQAPV